MSGPKVVRVVTREERIATCEALLARVAAALEEWERVGRRNDTVSDKDVVQMRARCDELKRLLASDRFDDVQRQATGEAQFIQKDQERRLSEAIEKRKRARQAQERTGKVAAELRAALDRNRSVSEQASESQRSLAQRLKESEDTQSYEQWLAERPVTNQAMGVIEQRLAELAVLLGDEHVDEFESRLRGLADETSPVRRAMLEDNLTIQLAQAVREARQRVLLQGRMRELIAELACLRSDIATRAADSLLRALDGETEALGKLEADAVKILESEREAQAARARREVVLKGLAALGYQVNEGLETAWVQAGRVVVKRPSQPGYGVELGGSGDKGRMQVRVVALRPAGAPADGVRDQDAERMWCSDVGRLEKSIASAGGDLIIERALPVGATPLKVVSDDVVDTTAASEMPSLRERTLPRP